MIRLLIVVHNPLTVSNSGSQMMSETCEKMKQRLLDGSRNHSAACFGGSIQNLPRGRKAASCTVCPRSHSEPRSHGLHLQLHCKVISLCADAWFKNWTEELAWNVALFTQPCKHTPPVIGNTIGLQFDCELSNYRLINGSAEETEGTVGICNHIFFQVLSAPLCFFPPFTINNNFNKDRTKLHAPWAWLWE